MRMGDSCLARYGRHSICELIRSSGPLEHPVEDPDREDDLVHLGDPFAFNLRSALWLCGTAAVVLTLFVLRMMGLIH